MMILFFFVMLPLVASSSLMDRFERWSERFQHMYSNDEHRSHVFSVWVENDKYIDSVNAMNLTYTLGHNYFSGMNSAEFREYNGLNPFDVIVQPPSINIYDVEKVVCVGKCLKRRTTASGNGRRTTNAVNVAGETLECVNGCLQLNKIARRMSTPSSINWVEKGGVTGVKDQGQCGSCWSFSTTGALEGAYFVKYGRLPVFSEQQLVDCDNFQHGGKDHGCNGGLMDNAFNWIEKNNGLCSEESYPYVSGTTKSAGTCQTTCSSIEDSAVLNYVDVAKSSDDAMMSALTRQPVSIAIQADQKDFQLYQTGVFTGECGTGLDHGVLAVGYGSENGDDYYLVKNSWGTVWGDNGYIKLGRGAQYNNGQGQCGLLLQASYPEL